MLSRNAPSSPTVVHTLYRAVQSVKVYATASFTSRVIEHLNPQTTFKVIHPHSQFYLTQQTDPNWLKRTGRSGWVPISSADEKVCCQPAEGELSSVQTVRSEEQNSHAQQTKKNSEKLQQILRKRRLLTSSPDVAFGNSKANKFFLAKKFNKRTRSTRRNMEQQFQEDQPTTSTTKDTPPTDDFHLMDKSEYLDLLLNDQLLQQTNKQKEIVSLESLLSIKYCQQYDDWHVQLICGFNLLFHGLGSKKKLMRDFVQAKFAETTYILELEGYLSCTSVGFLAGVIIEKFFDGVESLKNAPLTDQCVYISSHLPSQLVLIVHSIDGIALRSSESQNCLSLLGASSSIFLIASIDHLNVQLLWEESHLLKFRWVYEHAPTLVPFDAKEIGHDFLKKDYNSSSSNTSQGISYILTSLTPTHLDILKLVATHQISHHGLKNLLTYFELFQKCRENLVLHSDSAMRTFLAELQEHGLIRVIKVTRQPERIQVPLPDHIIKAAILKQDEICEEE